MLSVCQTYNSRTWTTIWLWWLIDGRSVTGSTTIPYELLHSDSSPAHMSHVGISMNSVLYCSFRVTSRRIFKWAAQPDHLWESEDWSHSRSSRACRHDPLGWLDPPDSNQCTLIFSLSCLHLELELWFSDNQDTFSLPSPCPPSFCTVRSSKPSIWFYSSWCCCTLPQWMFGCLWCSWSSMDIWGSKSVCMSQVTIVKLLLPPWVLSICPSWVPIDHTHILHYSQSHCKTSVLIYSRSEGISNNSWCSCSWRPNLLLSSRICFLLSSATSS